MRIHQFLEHYGIAANPFSQEDAQADHIFRQHCAGTLYHPAWDKVLGDCSNPSTSVVFGEKGAGKTAMRLQLMNALAEHNTANPEDRAFVISYDDLNPFLDTFRDRLRGRKRHPDHALQSWRLWDHMDALLTLSTRRLCNVLSDGAEPDAEIPAKELKKLPRMRKRDLLMLAAFYDQSSDQSHFRRWRELRKQLAFRSGPVHWRLWLAVSVTVLIAFYCLNHVYLKGMDGLSIFRSVWPYLFIAAGWLPWLQRWLKLSWGARQIARQVRILEHGTSSLRRILSCFSAADIEGQPLPARDRSDDRYELLAKLQRILKPLGFTSLIVLVDRVDEPHLINGAASRMRDFLWSMFDNKFLKHPGIGFKMLLPLDVVYYLDREEKEFYERSRLDKQNLIKSLEWTGESLFDMATSRIRACLNSETDASLTIRTLFAEDVTNEDLVHRFARLRVPRHLFRFLYRLLTEHCNRSTEDAPDWKIRRQTLDTVLNTYERELEALDRGVGTG